MWRVSCLPLIISITPSLNRRPSPGSRWEWVCERGRMHLNRIEPHHRCCLNAECASPRETGLFSVHARWCPRGSRKGEWRDFNAARDVSHWTRGPDKTAPVIQSPTSPFEHRGPRGRWSSWRSRYKTCCSRGLPGTAAPALGLINQ